MNKKLIGVAVVLGLVAGVALADRTDVWLSSSVDVHAVDLRKLPDGGCRVMACGTYSKADGGASIERCAPAVEVVGANRTDCLSILNTRAPVLFKNAEGL